MTGIPGIDLQEVAGCIRGRIQVWRKKFAFATTCSADSMCGIGHAVGTVTAFTGRRPTVSLKRSGEFGFGTIIGAQAHVIL
jgi:hypothetical protein